MIVSAVPGAQTEFRWIAADAAVPRKLYAHGLRSAGTHPLVACRQSPGSPLEIKRVTTTEAWRWPLVQYGAHNDIAAVVLAVDEPHNVIRAVDQGRIPGPNVMVIWVGKGPMNDGLCHAVWFLAEPVHVNERSRCKPIRAVAVVAESMARVVGSDPRYARVARNPLYCEGRPGFHVEYGRKAGYHITGELLEYVPSGFELPRAEQLLTRAAAHNWLFDEVMRFAGRHSNLEASLMRVALSLNDTAPSRASAAGKRRSANRPNGREVQERMGEKGLALRSVS